jgi:hypothetical protein
MSTTNVTARYMGYYWKAYCHLDGEDYESQAKTHGSPRQAVDEVVRQIVAATGAEVETRYVQPKLYEIIVSNATGEL